MIRLVCLEDRAPCGARSSLHGVFDGIAGGALGLLGTIIASDNQKRATTQTNNMNYQIAKENNEAQERIAQANNQLQIDMMRENNEWSRQQAIDMFNMENEYNNPSAQAQRLLSAGFNPAVALSNGAIASSTGNAAVPSAAGSSISPSMPSFATPTMQVPKSTWLGSIEAMAALGNAVESFARAKKTGKETERYDEFLDQQLANMAQEQEKAKVETSRQQLLLTLDAIYMPQQKKAEIKRLWNQAFLFEYQGETEKANKALAEANEKLAKNKAKEVEEYIPYIKQIQEETIKNIQEQTNTEKHKQANLDAGAVASRAAAGASNAQARLFNENARLTGYQADQFKEMRPFLDSIIQSESEEKWSDMYLKKKTLLSRIEYILKSDILQEDGRQLLLQQIEQLKKSNDWYDVKMAADITLDILSGYESMTRSGRNNTQSTMDVVTPFFLKR